MKSAKNPGESDAAYLARSILMSSWSGMVAEAATIPLDTAKVRL